MHETFSVSAASYFIQQMGGYFRKTNMHLNALPNIWWSKYDVVN